MASDFGPIYTKGSSYRARAEARQREYRALKLGADHGRYGALPRRSRAMLRHPECIHHIDLDALLAHIETIAPPEMEPWEANLSARYKGI